MEILTRFPEVNQLLQDLLHRVQTILDDQLVGMYLFGSLASGDFDEDSDIDVLVVTVDEISGETFAALRAMHAQIYAGDSPWTIQLEVSYIPQAALHRYDPANARHPHIDRGSNRFFKMAHNESWIVQRHVLRGQGIALAGPAPQTLIDPVSPNDLQQAMLAILKGWAPQFLADPNRLTRRGGQSYVVLTLCRILYTLQHGQVVSKRVAARWAQESLAGKWIPLIGRAWAGRHNPGLEASPDDVNGTLAFIRFTLEQGQKHETVHKRNQMNTNDILALYDKEQRIEVEYPGLRKEDTGETIRFVGRPRPNDNFILYSRLTEDNADAIIEREIAYFDGIGHPFEWKVYDHDQPVDLCQHLLDRGFTTRDRDAIMVLDLQNAPDFLRQPDPTIDVRRLTRPEQLADVVCVLSQVWPDEDHEWLQVVIGNDLRERPDYNHVFVAYVADEPACAGWINFHENSQFASLWGGSTVAEHRKKRLYTAVTAARAQTAIQRGYRFLTIDASPMNEPIAASRGFQLLTYAHACHWRYD